MKLTSLVSIVVACGCGHAKASGPAPAAPSVPAALDADLKVFRAAHGQPYGPAQGPAIEAMTRIFDGIDFVAWPFDRVEQVLGPPDERMTRGESSCVEYIRHNGESGSIRRLCGGEAVVARVEVIPTQ